MIETQLEEKLLTVFKGFLTKHKDLVLSLNTTVDELRLDSLDTLELLMQIDKEFNINMPVERFALCRNLNDVKRLIQSIANI